MPDIAKADPRWRQPKGLRLAEMLGKKQFYLSSASKWSHDGVHLK